MQRSLLASSILLALIAAQAPAAAADAAVIRSGPPVYVEPAPVAVSATTGCWRYGTRGYGWYPCWAGPPAYWHTYKGWRPHWARQHWLFYR
jgi:hypothetical protein